MENEDVERELGNAQTLWQDLYAELLGSSSSVDEIILQSPPTPLVHTATLEGIEEYNFSSLNAPNSPVSPNLARPKLKRQTTLNAQHVLRQLKGEDIVRKTQKAVNMSRRESRTRLPDWNSDTTEGEDAETEIKALQNAVKDLSSLLRAKTPAPEVLEESALRNLRGDESEREDDDEENTVMDEGNKVELGKMKREVEKRSYIPIPVWRKALR